jgi:hypothetical protein
VARLKFCCGDQLAAAWAASAGTQQLQPRHAAAEDAGEVGVRAGNNYWPVHPITVCLCTHETFFW